MAAPKKQRKTATGTASTQMAGVVKFVPETVHRQDLHEAAYNPRTIAKSAYEKLKAEIKKYGLVAPIVVNKRTMNIVGGHQRLRAMDDLEGTKDYTLPVAMCDLSPKDEKRMNVILNNRATQGEMDVDKLNALVRAEGFLLDDDLLFDPQDIAVIQEETGFLMDDVGRGLNEAVGEIEAVKEMTEDEVQQARANRKKQKEEMGALNDKAFYFGVVAETGERVRELLAVLRMNDDQQIVKAETFAAVLLERVQSGEIEADLKAFLKERRR